MKRVKTILMVSVLLVTVGCAPKTTNTESNIQKEDSTQTEIVFETSTDKTMIHLEKGEKIELIPDKVYVIGENLKQGTYKIEYTTNDTPSSIYIQLSTTCTVGVNEAIVNDGSIKGIFDFNYDFYFEDGNTLKILGTPETATIEFLTEKNEEYAGLWCNK